MKFSKLIKQPGLGDAILEIVFKHILSKMEPSKEPFKLSDLDIIMLNKLSEKVKYKTISMFEYSTYLRLNHVDKTGEPLSEADKLMINDFAIRNYDILMTPKKPLIKTLDECIAHVRGSGIYDFLPPSRDREYAIRDEAMRIYSKQFPYPFDPNYYKNQPKMRTITNKKAPLFHYSDGQGPAVQYRDASGVMQYIFLKNAEFVLVTYCKKCDNYVIEVHTNEPAKEEKKPCNHQ